MEANSHREYYRAFIGPNNQKYYLKKYDKFSTEGKTCLAWHWPAFFFTQFWLLYRKMWLYALLYFLLPIFTQIIPSILISLLGISTEGNIALLPLLTHLVITFFVLPAYANSFYYKHCNKKIDQILQASDNETVKQATLVKEGGTGGAAFIIVIAFIFIALIGILAAIAIPAYQDYTLRAKVAQGLSSTTNIRLSVTEYYLRKGELPISLEEIGVDKANSDIVKNIQYDPSDGSIIITYSGSVIENKSVKFEPFLDDKDNFRWDCKSVDIDDRYLPSACRR